MFQRFNSKSKFYGADAKNKFSGNFKVELAIFDKGCHFNPDSASRASLISQVSTIPTAAKFTLCVTKKIITR